MLFGGTCGCGSFARSGLKWYATRSEVEAMKSGSAANVVSDVLQKWQKFVYLLAAIITLSAMLVPKVQSPNLMVPGRNASWREQYNLPHKSYPESKWRRTNRACFPASLCLTFKS